jgi:hypothetical protein
MPDYTLSDISAMSGPSTYTLNDVQGMQPSTTQQVLNGARDALAGAVRGAGSIGATILAPVDWLAQKAGVQNDFIGRDDRRDLMDAGLQQLTGADPTSIAYRTGKLGGEIAGTAGVGGTLAAGVRALPIAARFTAPLATAIETGGFRTGGGLAPVADIGTRIAGGAITGGASAGLVDPSASGSGAVIGGALPVGMRAAGMAGMRVANAVKSAIASPEAKIAQNLGNALGVTADDLTGAITGPQMIPGYVPTVPQIVQNPVASQLQRTLKSAGSNAIGDVERAQQGQFRDALGRIAPIDNTVQDAAARAGSAIQSYAVPAEAAARKGVSNLFDAVPSDQAVMNVPLDAMTAARDKFLGPGTFGKGGAAVDQALQAAQSIGTSRVPMPVDYSSSDLSRLGAGRATAAGTQVVPQPVPFDQLQNLRSSIGEAIKNAQMNGQARAAAALTDMKNAIDNKVADVASGNALPGEVFTPQAIDAWGQALAAHGGKKLQFNTGPQAAMFRMGADGQPAIQGAEIPGKFYNANRSQVEDMQAFNRLSADQPNLANEMKRYAVTQGYATSNQAGDLTSKFTNWLAARSGANHELFNPQELATLNQVGSAVDRAAIAENLGRVSGSDTAQKLASLQSNGLLDNRVVDVLAHRIPLIGHFAGPALDGLRASAARTRQNVMGGLLADPQQFADALRRGPGLLNYNPEGYGLLSQGAYRVLPLLPAQ